MLARLIRTLGLVAVLAFGTAVLAAGDGDTDSEGPSSPNGTDWPGPKFPSDTDWGGFRLSSYWDWEWLNLSNEIERGSQQELAAESFCVSAEEWGECTHSPNSIISLDGSDGPGYNEGLDYWTIVDSYILEMLAEEPSETTVTIPWSSIQTMSE